MKFLCHRGYWKKASEKNSRDAFLRGYSLGLGIETDIRDINGQIVISHDPATSDAMLFTDFLDLTPRHLLLALNVKSDGLARLVGEQLEIYGHQQYFFFDMSIPDLIYYKKLGLPYAVRVSEYEKIHTGLEYEADYIWLDGFLSAWYTHQDIENILTIQKIVVVVSNELHGRSNVDQWNLLSKYKDNPNVILCTDYPEEAIEYFGGLND